MKNLTYCPMRMLNFLWDAIANLIRQLHLLSTEPKEQFGIIIVPWSKYFFIGLPSMKASKKRMRSIIIRLKAARNPVLHILKLQFGSEITIMVDRTELNSVFC